MGVMRLGYVHVRVTDLDAATRHYRDTLGMKLTADTGSARAFKGWDEFDHHSVVIEDGGVGLAKMGLKCRSTDDLETYERRLGAFGITPTRMGKGETLAVGEGLRFQLPTEQTVELYTDMEFLGTETGTLNPFPAPRDPRGVMVPRLDHILIAGEDPALVEQLFTEVFDFNVSERLITDPGQNELVASWMFTGNSSHDVAILKGENGKLHHFAFYVDEWKDVLRAGDVFAADDVSVDYGPTRHGITRGTTMYFFDPSGNRNEVFAGSYKVYADTPTITWTMDEFARGLSSLQREVNESFLSVFT